METEYFWPGMVGEPAKKWTVLPQEGSIEYFGLASDSEKTMRRYGFGRDGLSRSMIDGRPTKLQAGGLCHPRIAKAVASP